jgi:hypothetical protein
VSNKCFGMSKMLCTQERFLDAFYVLKHLQNSSKYAVFRGITKDLLGLTRRLLRYAGAASHLKSRHWTGAISARMPLGSFCA